MSNASLQEAIKWVLARTSEDKHFGKTKLMKHLYFLSESGGLTADGLNFELFTWGPYSAPVLNELAELESRAEVVVEEPNEPGHSYCIHLASETQAPVITNENAERVISALKGLKAKDLEALSTLHMVLKSSEGDEEATVQTVKNLKPYFSVPELRDYLTKLKELELS